MAAFSRAASSSELSLLSQQDWDAMTQRVTLSSVTPGNLSINGESRLQWLRDLSSNEYIASGVRKAVSENRAQQLLVGEDHFVHITANGQVYVPLNQCVGEGGQKRVFTVVNAETGKMYVLKECQIDLATDNLQSFIDEYKLGLQLSKKIISKPVSGSLVVDDTNQIKPTVMYLEKYMRNGDLNSFRLLCSSRQKELMIVSQMANLVAWFNKKGFLHRDIKPGNFFIKELDDRGFPTLRLGDLGEATRINDEAKRGQEGGTQEYLAPEIMDSRGANPTLKSDAWALGMSMLYLLAKNNYAMPNLMDQSQPEAQTLRQALNLDSENPFHRGRNLPAIYEALSSDNLRNPPSENTIEFVIYHLLRPTPEERWTAQQAAEYLNSMSYSPKPEKLSLSQKILRFTSSVGSSLARASSETLFMPAICSQA